MGAVDVALGIAWILAIAWLGRFMIVSRKRHAWTEVSSADVATTIRRVRRPR